MINSYLHFTKALTIQSVLSCHNFFDPINRVGNAEQFSGLNRFPKAENTMILAPPYISAVIMMLYNS